MALIRKIKVNGQVYDISADYNNLINKPTIPNPANDGKLTLTVNNDNNTKVEFTADQAGNSNFNVSVPTKTSDLTNDGSGTKSGTNYLTTVQDVKSMIEQAQTGAAMFQGVLEYPDTEVGHDLPPQTYKAGYYWVVETAGTYAGQECEVGDFVYCIKDGTASSSGDSWKADFKVVQANITQQTFDTRYLKKDDNDVLAGGSNSTHKITTFQQYHDLILNSTESVGSTGKITSSQTNFDWITTSDGNGGEVSLEDRLQVIAGEDNIKDYYYASYTFTGYDGTFETSSINLLNQITTNHKLPVIKVTLSSYTYTSSGSTVTLEVPVVITRMSSSSGTCWGSATAMLDKIYESDEIGYGSGPASQTSTNRRSVTVIVSDSSNSGFKIQVVKNWTKFSYDTTTDSNNPTLVINTNT